MGFSHTFVVPSHNQADYVGLTVESLLAQDMAGSEIVVSEDFSVDHSMDVLRRFGDRIRIVQPPEHRGMAFNWNWGVSHARTEWVSIMGADDLALPRFTRVIAAGVAAHPGAVVVSGDVDQIDADGRVLLSAGTVTAKRVVSPPETLYRLVPANMVQVAAHAFRRDAWEKAGGFETRLRLYGDWGLWLKLSALGDFAHVRQIIAQYRVAYRPGIAKGRLPQSLRDDVDVQMTLIPEIAATMSGIDAARLRAGGRQRFRAVLRETAGMLEADERVFAVEILRDWAGQVGERRLLERFADGGAVPTGWRGSRARGALREAYRRVRSVVRPRP